MRRGNEMQCDRPPVRCSLFPAVVGNTGQRLATVPLRKRWCTSSRFLRCAVLALVAYCSACAQETLADRITFSGGWSHEVDNQRFPHESATGLGISYGHRFRPWLEAEAGLFTALDPTGVQCASFGCHDASDHYYWVPFGVRFIAPLYRRRIELSVGGGGLYEKYSGDFLGVGPLSRSGGGGYFVGSAAVALDRGRHFWVDATPRWFLANASYAKDRWLQISAEISFRFR